MPELPEVETTVRALRRPLLGQTITSVWNDWPRLIVTPPFSELQDRIRGKKVQAINRRGKYLVLSLSDHETLLLHLKMSGHLSVVSADQKRHKHVHTIFYLANGQALHFRDQRKFGRVYLVRKPAEILSSLGPEPLENTFTPEVLMQRLNGRRRVLKPLLLDQTFVAGLGNIYADEALFFAGILPTRTADTLTGTEIQALHAAIQKVLRLGIQREGASLDLYIKPDGSRGDMQNAVAVFRRTGQPCYQCHHDVQRIKLGGRSTHYCPSCQK